MGWEGWILWILCGYYAVKPSHLPYIGIGGLYMNLKIRINKLVVDYDTDYGIDRKRGWSIAWNGQYIIILESTVKTIYTLWRMINE